MREGLVQLPAQTKDPWERREPNICGGITQVGFRGEKGKSDSLPSLLRKCADWLELNKVGDCDVEDMAVENIYFEMGDVVVLTLYTSLSLEGEAE